jgi:hypothetical protein
VLTKVDDLKRVELAEAAYSAAIAESLRAIDDASPASAWPIGGGQLVITGAGFYINRAIAIGLTAPMTEDDFALLERRCGSVGVVAEAEVCPWAEPTLLALASDRGYRVVPYRSGQ